MSFSVLLAMFSYSLVMSISPGPVNMIILSSGMNYGLKRTFSFLSGATIGFTLLLILVGVGLNQLIVAYPLFLKILTLFGCSFIIYLGYKIFTTTSSLNTQKLDTPPTFIQGSSLQWLNPKAWIAAVSGIGMFSQEDNLMVLITFLGVYFITCYACLLIWALAGEQALKLLNNQNRLSIFNKIMGSVLICIAILLLIKEFV